MKFHAYIPAEPDDFHAVIEAPTREEAVADMRRRGQSLRDNPRPGVPAPSRSQIRDAYAIPVR